MTHLGCGLVVLDHFPYDKLIITDRNLQEYFMDLYLLAELKTISLKITTVDMKRPPADFRSNFEAAQPPILIDNGVAILENDKAR